MKPTSVGRAPPNSRKPNASSLTPLGWVIVLLVGPIWLVSAAIHMLVTLPEKASFWLRKWSAETLDATLKRLGFGGRS